MYNKPGMKPATFLDGGEGGKGKAGQITLFANSCLCYYACRRGTTVKTVFVRFYGRQSANLERGRCPRGYVSGTN